MPKLTLILKNKPLGNYQLRKGDSITIGRREDNSVVIDDPAVSGHHAKIDSMGNRFMIIDLQSKNGSFVNEQLIATHWLMDGDVINIGDHALLYNQKAGKKRAKDKSNEFDDTLIMNSSHHRRMMKKSIPHKSINVVGFWDKGQKRGTVKDVDPRTPPAIAASKKEKTNGTLTYLAGGTGRIELTRKITTIGKHPTSDIVVKGLLLDPTTVTISNEIGGFYFNYIGGLPKPKINDITAGKSVLLTDSDIIEIGSTRLRFSSNPGGQPEKVHSS
jgi:pSer/pThr/pTyr-binding forkhead associated (FHA) protein